MRHGSALGGGDQLAGGFLYTVLDAAAAVGTQDAHRLFALVQPGGKVFAQLRRDDGAEPIQEGDILAGGGNVVAGNVQHNVKLIFQVFALDGGKPQLDRLHFAALIGLQGIVLLDAQGADGVAGDRKDGIDHGVLQLARRVPGSVAVLAALGGGF